MEDRTSILHVSLGLGSPPSLPPGCVVLLLDTLQANGEFLLHHLAQAHLSRPNSVLLWVAFSQTLSHHATVGKKLVHHFLITSPTTVVGCDNLFPLYHTGKVQTSLRGGGEVFDCTNHWLSPDFVVCSRGLLGRAGLQLE